MKTGKEKLEKERRGKIQEDDLRNPSHIMYKYLFRKMTVKGVCSKHVVMKNKV